MEEKDLRAVNNSINTCTLGTQTGPQTIVVRQVVGERERQKVLDIHVVVPSRKPAIEQIIDVFVKDVEVNCVEVITNKVIVRGEFEIKAIYVACLPDQPVHAVEIKHYKWTQDIEIPGARRGMDADANVMVEFVDFDVDEDTCAYRHKYYDCNGDDHDCHHHHKHHHHHHHHDDNDDEDPDNCGCPDDNGNHNHDDDCTREFDVSVVLKITAKVLADREVQVGAVGTTGTLGVSGTVPQSPKG